MYPALVKVRYWDDDAHDMVESAHLLMTVSFSDAAQQMEDYYGKELDALSIEMYADGYITIPMEKYDEVKHWLEELY